MPLFTMVPRKERIARMSRNLIVIPARLAASRLPGKPMADIHGEPMIVHVWRRAMEANCGPVIVACDAAEIADAIDAAGGRAVMTRVDHPSGSDRIWEAVEAVTADHPADVIINLQGDLPTLDPWLVQRVAALLDDDGVDVGTLAAEIVREEERDNPAVVKAIGTPLSDDRLRALYFTRATAPSGDGPLYHHIGIYAYRRASLERFVRLPPSTLERRERLEQLRALEAGMRIDVALVDTVPLGVDTPVDLERARAVISAT